jgi:hypothetical protein
MLLSLGFVEHFRDLDAVFARHRELVRPGGTVVVTVPNFQGLNRVVQRVCDPDWLELHNNAAMGVERLRDLGTRHGLEPRTGRYFGGFDPDVISTRRRGRSLLAPAWRLRHAGVGDRANAWWLSSFLMVTYRRSGTG